MLAVIQPMDNAPECSNAACHVHPADQRVLGVIDANLSLDTVDEQMSLHQANLAYFLVGAILLGSALAVAFIWIVVYRPVKKLIAGTHRVADGDLTYRLPVGSDDELGDLARSFNKMTAKVEGVQAEIEERVRRKTAELEKIHKTLLSSEKMASIGKLAATVAHEINNPLFGILTYARLTLRGIQKLEFEGRDEMAEQLQTIERESKRCGDLVKSLLTFSRQAPSQREPQDLNTVVHRAVQLVKHKLRYAEHRVDRKAGGGPAAGGMRRQPDSAGDSGADGERLGGNAQGRHARGGHGVRRGRRTGRGACEGLPARASRRRCCRASSTRSSPPRKTRTARAWVWRWRRALSSSMRARSPSGVEPGEGTEFRVALPATAAAPAGARQ